MSLGLKHYDEFKKVLAGYQMSERARRSLEGMHLVLMVAISSTGRNTMIRELLKTGDYYFIVSDTTRSPQFRDGKLEEHGQNYFFRTEEEILADLEAGEFLEAAIIHEQQVSGISIRELEKANALNKIAITDIEPVGAANIMKEKSDAVAIFMLPPSFEEWQKRLNQRGEMSQAEIRNRMDSAKKELKVAKNTRYYQFVVADDLGRTVPLVDKLAHGHRDEAEQARGRETIEQLLNKLD